MNKYIELPAERRELLCNQAQAALGLPAASIEKDFWVCLTLRELFALPDWGDNLTFKGGTSLSKGWGLIERFSEDIDITIGRDFLGFAGESSPEHASSGRDAKRRLAAMKAECQKRVHDELHSLLEERLRGLLPDTDDWKIEPAALDDDPDGQTLLFVFPNSLTKTASYLRADVKIEMGARSDTEPSEAVTIVPYLAEAFPDELGECAFTVKALAPERTFWEKAMLLHEEQLRPFDKLEKRKARMARHYYDLWCLITKGVGERAAAREDIFTRTAEHRQIYFKWSWVDYDTLRRGSLSMLPPEDQMTAWKQDYAATVENMFFGDVPDFDEVLRVAAEFQDAFNRG